MGRQLTIHSTRTRQTTPLWLVLRYVMNMKSLHDLQACLAVISSNVTAYQSGNIHAYRPVAVELRKLFCDTQKKTDNSLINRFFPYFRLHPLLGNQNRIDEHTVLYIPGQMNFNGRVGSSLSQLFNESAPSLLLDEWLQQKLFDFTTTIKDFIRSVADKEGAHSDKSYNTVLRKTKSVVLSDDALTAKAILAMSLYVVKALAIRMVNDNIAEIGAHVVTEHNKIGRGVAVLNLTEFANRFLEGIPIKYEPASAAEPYFQRDPSKCETAMRILQVYQPSDYFILLVIDLNGEIWLYQQAIKTGT